MVDKNTDAHVNTKEFFRTLTPRDFLSLGMRDMAYIRPVDAGDGSLAYAVHAADGTPLSVMDDLNTAIVMARHNDLEPLTLQ